MPVPKYDAAGVASVTMDNGEFFPLNSDGFQANQSSAKARGGQIKTTTWNTELFRTYIAHHSMVTEAKKNALLTFFDADNVDYMANQFEFFPDSAGAALDMLLLQDKINIREIHEGFFDIIVRMQTVVT